MIQSYKLYIFNPTLSFTEDDKNEIEEVIKRYTNKKFQIKLLEVNKDYFILEADGELHSKVTQTISRYIKNNSRLNHLYSTQHKRLFTSKR